MPTRVPTAFARTGAGYAHTGGGEQTGLVNGVAVVLDLHRKAPHADHRATRGDGRAERGQDGPG
jgi:hypothetical protein